MKSGMAVFAGILTGLFSGAMMGMFNALMIATLSISPFIVTLGSVGIYRAIALILTDARPIYGLPVSFCFLGNGWVGPLPVSVLIALLAIGLGYLVISWTNFGTYARAIGNNEKGAFRSGISIIRVRLGIYALAGISAALAGIIMAGRLNTAEAIAGLGMELEAIAAVVIGGTGFSGGDADMAGTLLGALIIGTLANGLTIVNKKQVPIPMPDIGRTGPLNGLTVSNREFPLQGMMISGPFILMPSPVRGFEPLFQVLTATGKDRCGIWLRPNPGL